MTHSPRMAAAAITIYLHPVLPEARASPRKIFVVQFIENQQSTPGHSWQHIFESGFDRRKEIEAKIASAKNSFRMLPKGCYGSDCEITLSAVFKAKCLFWALS